MFEYNLITSISENNEVFLIKFFTYGLLPLLISGLLLVISLIFSKSEKYLEKISAYECGFEPFDDARQKFNVSFYIVAILFLIFDIEIIYLLPWVITMSYCGIQAFIFIVIFLFLLAIGFLYEVFKGALVWP